MEKSALPIGRKRVEWIFLTFQLLCTFLRLHGQPLNNLPPAVLEFIDEQERVTQSIAEKAVELHRRRIQLVRDCKCSVSTCSNVFSQSPCETKIGTPPMCGDTPGRHIFSNMSSLRIPPGENVDNPRHSIKENICIYRGLDETFSQNEKPDSPWLYFGASNRYHNHLLYGVHSVGTRDGHFRNYPAIADPRDNEIGTDPRSCSRYDPRVRPWYISASTGPKDVVIVLDKSTSMAETLGPLSRSKLDVAQKATLDILQLFSFVDFVNVVTFSDEAAPLYGEMGLVRGSSENIGRLSDAVIETFPEGSTNFTAAFTTAFRLLSNCTEEPKTCSNCQKIILFLTDGKDTTEDGESIKPSKMSSIINDLQNDLSKKTKSRASIFTYSMTELADDNIPRQIACANRGAWSFIGPNTDALNALNSYYLYIADNRRSTLPIWIEPYEDFAGLGLVTTVSLPVFASGSDTVKGALLGVAGHDVTMAELRRDGVTEQEVLNAIVQRSERCSISSNTQCDFQVIRNSTDPRAVCPDPYPSFEVRELRGQRGTTPLPFTCFMFRNRFYKRTPTDTNWKAARQMCQDDGGRLAVVKDREELAFLANMAHPDGSWIGADNPSSHVYRWIDPSVPDIHLESDYWGVGEPDRKGEVSHCVSIDTRGRISNLDLRDCNEQQTAICEYPSDESCPRVNEVPEEGYFVVPPLDACIDSTEIFDETRPLPESKDLKSEDIICDLGNPQSTEQVICCGTHTTDNSQSSEKNLNGSKILLWVSLIILFVFIW